MTAKGRRGLLLLLMLLGGVGLAIVELATWPRSIAPAARAAGPSTASCDYRSAPWDSIEVQIIKTTGALDAESGASLVAELLPSRAAPVGGSIYAVPITVYWTSHQLLMSSADYGVRVFVRSNASADWRLVYSDQVATRRPRPQHRGDDRPAVDARENHDDPIQFRLFGSLDEAAGSEAEVALIDPDGYERGAVRFAISRGLPLRFCPLPEQVSDSALPRSAAEASAIFVNDLNGRCALQIDRPIASVEVFLGATIELLDADDQVIGVGRVQGTWWSMPLEEPIYLPIFSADGATWLAASPRAVSARMTSNCELVLQYPWSFRYPAWEGRVILRTLRYHY